MYKNPGFFCLIIIIIMTINGCSGEKIWITKIKLSAPLIINFTTCWGEETPRGKAIKQIVDNYNLSRSDEITINLQTISDIEEYKSELKTLTATNLLPDVFILEKNKNDMSIELSAKLMDFSSYKNDEAWIKNNVRYLPEDYVNNRLVSLCFEYPTMRLYFHRDMVESLGFYSISDSSKFIYKLFNKISDIEKIPIMTDYFGRSRSSTDFFYYICSQKKDFDVNSKEDWMESLRIWKNFCRISQIQEKNGYSKNVARWMDKEAACFIDDSTLYSRLTDTDNIDSVILTDIYGNVLLGSPLSFAASKQSSKEREKEIILFLKHLMTSSWLNNNTEPKAQNSFVTFDMEGGKVLESRSINPKLQENVTVQLQLVTTGQNSLSNAANALVELYKEEHNKELVN